MSDSGPTGEERVISWFQDNQYNSQGRGHLDAVVDAFLNDLIDENEVVQDAAKGGELVHTRNFSLDGPSFLGDVDLVIGSAANPPQQQFGDRPTIAEGKISDVWLSLNIESLISSIQKNWTNRGRDIHSFYLSIYEKHPTALTGSIILFNTTDLEDRDPGDIIGPYRDFELAEGSLVRQLDSLAIIPMEKAQTPMARRDEEFISTNDALHYNNLVSTLADGLATRIQGNFDISEATLDALLTHDESEQLEFKRKISDTKDIAKEAVAFANSQGGRILIGVSNSGQLIGLSEPNATEEAVAQVLRDRVTPDVTDSIKLHRIEDSAILEVRVRPMDEFPASMNGVFYRRDGTTTSRMTGVDIYERYLGG